MTDTTNDRKTSWAEQMSDLEDDVSDDCPVEIQTEEKDPEKENDEEKQEETDACELLLRFFPVPGELWVHLCASVNYLSSLLKLYPPCARNDTPYIINSWRDSKSVGSDGSPFRIVYGTKNPAMRGVIIASEVIIPSFSWTPRLLLTTEQMMEVLQNPLPPAMLCVPAIVGMVVRLFQIKKLWFIADNESVEPLFTTDNRLNGHLGVVFEACLVSHFAPTLDRFTKDLIKYKDRVWFFGLFPNRQTMTFLGTCKQISHSQVEKVLDDEIDLDFNLHDYLAPSIPILSSSVDYRETCYDIFDPSSMHYTSPYDGILIINTVSKLFSIKKKKGMQSTMFAVRLSIPEVIFLRPLLACEMKVTEFLTRRVLESKFIRNHTSYQDPRSQEWWIETIPFFSRFFFGHRDVLVLQRITWHLENIPEWMPIWIQYISTLPWQEWQLLDTNMQRLFILLDYENAKSWNRIICNPRYIGCLAKAILFCLEQWEGLSIS